MSSWTSLYTFSSSCKKQISCLLKQKQASQVSPISEHRTLLPAPETKNLDSYYNLAPSIPSFKPSKINQNSSKKSYKTHPATTKNLTNPTKTPTKPANIHKKNTIRPPCFAPTLFRELLSVFCTVRLLLGLRGDFYLSLAEALEVFL